ncbi:hypothetical protein [Vreelandella sp. EE27]
MPKPPITVPIARSNYPALIHSALAAGLLGVSLAFASPLWVLCALPVVLFLIAHNARRQPAGTLYIQPLDDALYARWVLASGDLDDQQPLRCHYLGPWLLGLEVGGERLWLWPDSLRGENHRALRRLLHRPGR